MRALVNTRVGKDVLYWIDDDKKEIIPNINFGRVKSISIPVFAQQNFNNQGTVYANDKALFYKAFTEYYIVTLGEQYKIYRVVQQQMPQNQGGGLANSPG